MNQKTVKNIVLIATSFAIVVLLLGAFTRLSHAGLGCPDWPGCYGFHHIPTAQDDIHAANQAYPDKPYQFEKAWPEMVHRYFAGTLGLLVLALAILSLKPQNHPARLHSFGLLLLIIFQAALGMWTVTMKLHPGIVMSHLMGGITTLVLLASLSQRYILQFKTLPPIANLSRTIRIVMVATLVVALQIVLGGWTSANYAATVCIELPICQGDWISNSDFVTGFTLWGHGAENYEYGILDSAGRTAIHVSHRIGAIISLIVVGYTSYFLVQKSESLVLKKFGYLIGALLLIQISLGIINIVAHLPLFNAVAHNGGWRAISLDPRCSFDTFTDDTKESNFRWFTGN
ncbi:MAG: COX15/CtaA family protein [Enterobacterales bacterium]|nr:COX15/CtaA family protein [Enterobacterales bacterium]